MPTIKLNTDCICLGHLAGNYKKTLPSHYRQNPSQSEHAYYCSHIINFNLLQVCPPNCICCFIYTLFDFRDQSLFMYGGGGGRRGWRDIIFINQLLFYRLWPLPQTHTHKKQQNPQQKYLSKIFLKTKAVLLWTVNWLEIPLKDLKWC